ncbi:MAG: hypothetical protein WBA97_13860 [Actinophytocola sp.]|uniref:hypothetical protein n=1 Tax=Actinophytocola sp. TaxID=1872138 RepID=UPI003C75682C
MNNEGQREEQYKRRIRVLMGHLLPEAGQQPPPDTGKSPDELYGTAKLPGKVKQQEAPYDKDNVRTTGDIVAKEGVTDAPMRINAAYYDLDANSGGFTPAGGVTYLWAIKEDDSHLVVGVEDPTKMSAAFGVDPKETVSAMQAKKSQLGEDIPADNVLDGLGHPTLAVKFGPNGEALVGKARISGELEEHEGSWKINDHSGRYSAGRTEVVPYLINAATKFQRFGIDVQYIQSKVQLEDRIMSLADLQEAKL